MRVPIRHLKIVDDFTFVPDVIACGHHIDPKVKELFGQSRSDAEAGGCVLAVRDNEVDGMLFDDLRQAFFDDGSPRPSKNVADEKNVQGQ